MFWIVLCLVWLLTIFGAWYIGTEQRQESAAAAQSGVKGPPKYLPNILPPRMRPKYERGDPYQLQRDISAALRTPAAARTSDQHVLAFVAKYTSNEWNTWTREQTLAREATSNALDSGDAPDEP